MNRLTWADARFSTVEGSAGGINLFSVSYGTSRREAMWHLSTRLPVHSKLLGQVHATSEDAKAAAERVLEAFINRINQPVEDPS